MRLRKRSFAAREIRLRRVKCLRAWVDLFHFTLRSETKQYFTICKADYFTFAGRQIFHLKYQLKRKNRMILIVILFLFASAHLLTTFCGGHLTKLSLRTNLNGARFFLIIASAKGRTAPTSRRRAARKEARQRRAPRRASASSSRAGLSVWRSAIR